MQRLIKSVQRWIPSAKDGVVVLAYHLVGAETDSAVDIPLSEFQNQLDLLLTHYEVVSLGAAIQAFRTPVSTGRPLAVLTFDDAYENFFKVVWPLLEKRRMPSILYVPVGFVRGTAPPPLTGAAMSACSWPQLRDLARSGVEIGSHGVNHLNLRRASKELVNQELLESRSVLEQELGIAVESFCYPQAKYSSEVADAAARNYESAVAAGGRRFRGGDRYSIPRFPVRRDGAFDEMVKTHTWVREAIANEVRQWRA